MLHKKTIKKRIRKKTLPEDLPRLVGLLKKEEKKHYNYKAISVGFEGHDPVIRSQGVATQQLINSRGNTKENRRARKSELAVFAVKRRGKAIKSMSKPKGIHGVQSARGLNVPALH